MQEILINWETFFDHEWIFPNANSAIRMTKNSFTYYGGIRFASPAFSIHIFF